MRRDVIENLVSARCLSYSRLMPRIMRFCLVGLFWCAVVFPLFSDAATKPHLITFGKWISVLWFVGSGAEDEKPLTLKMRSLMVDGRVKEYVVGSSHEVTDRLFVVRRVIRVNDGLPGDSSPRWQWQRGGWLLVDRVTGRVSAINLPEFDSFYSAASWYRDYVAYCGVSDDGKKIYTVVAQLSRRKPVLKKPLSNEAILNDSVPDSACPMPVWQRNPARVSFDVVGGRQTFAIRGHVVDLMEEENEE